MFGGSSLLHLLAGYPRVVAAFGVMALTTSTLQTPFGAPVLPGTAGYVAQLDRQVVVADGLETAITVDRARRAARVLEQRSSPAGLAEIVDTMLARCGRGCNDLDSAAVLENPSLLQNVLLLHALDNDRTNRLSARLSPSVEPR